MKKVLSILLTVVLMLSMVICGITTVSAEIDGYYTYEVVDGEATITDVDTSISGNITIPSTLGGYPLTGIGENAFCGCKSAVSVLIPDSVSFIDTGAFDGCSALVNVNIPNGVENICYGTFSGCKSLKGIIIPNSVTKIDWFAFSGCAELEEILIPESVLEIGKYVFSDCIALGSINVDSKNKNYYAKDNCLVETNNNTLIVGCKNSIISDGIAIIGEGAFSGCTELDSINIPNSVVSINESAFFSCCGLTEVNITDINAWCSIDFEGVFANPLYYAEKLILDSKVITELVIPEGITHVNEFAFNNSKEIESIVFSDSVSNIGDGAFFGCTNVEKITIPGSVTHIGFSAFEDCDKLDIVYYNGTKENWNNINIKSYNDDLISAKIIYSTDKFELNELENINKYLLTKGDLLYINSQKFSGSSALKIVSGSKIKFAFYGDYFNLLSYKSPTQGKMYVKIDNGEEVEIDLKSDKYDTYFQEVIYKSEILDYNTHTVEIRVDGNVYLDAIKVLGELVTCTEAICEKTTYEAENMNLDFEGEWNSVYAWKLSNHRALQATNGQKATFTYTGYGFEIISYKSRTQGNVFISIDGAEPVNIRLYNNSVDENYKTIAISRLKLSYGTHTVEITTEGKVILDAIKIDGTLN